MLGIRGTGWYVATLQAVDSNAGEDICGFVTEERRRDETKRGDFAESCVNTVKQGCVRWPRTSCSVQRPEQGSPLSGVLFIRLLPREECGKAQGHWRSSSDEELRKEIPPPQSSSGFTHHAICCVFAVKLSADAPPC